MWATDIPHTTADWAALAALGGLLLSISVNDWRHHRIPNRWVYGGTLAAFAAAPWLPAGGYLPAGVGGLAGFAILAALYLGRPGVIGGGDVKLAALLGVALGWPLGLWALLLAPGFALVVAVPMLAVRRWTLRQRIAFAPALCAAGAATATLAVLA